MAYAPYQLRLPTYRGSWQRRYHPYPRYHPSVREQVDPLMQTVDYRYSQPPPRPPPRPLFILVLAPIDEVDETIDNLEEVVRPENAARRDSTLKRRPSLTGLVVDLAIRLVLWRRRRITVVQNAGPDAKIDLLE